MIQTQQFSIGGYVFTLENDAVSPLQNYFSELENHYLSQEGGKEIMEGIEERVAELLLDKAGKNGVVTLTHVQSVIDIIGRPERIEADDPEPDPHAEKPRKRLYRDLENKRLGGVCSGFAAYLDFDVTALRIIVAVLAAAGFLAFHQTSMVCLSIPVLYCLLWVAMPAARTAQERWAMKGDAGTLDDISRNVKEGIREIGETAREAGSSDFIRNAFRVLLVVIGITLLITGTSGLASISVLGLKGTELFGTPALEWLEELAEDAPGLYNLLSTPWVVALTALAVILPFVGMLYGGIQLIFGFRSPSWRPGLVIFVLWLIVVVVLAVLGFAGAVSSEMCC